jgi:hypothetical protein
MPQVFMSYRRDDSAADTLLIHERLKAAFGSDVLFLDIDTLGAGVKFVSEILEAVNHCNALIAVIGKQWLTITDSNGKRRLDNPDDILRMEIAAALERDIRVIPLLVGGATMPPEKELPDNLKPLAQRNALNINYNSLDHDVGKLIKALENALSTSANPQAEKIVTHQSVAPTVLVPTLSVMSEFFGFTLEDLELNRQGIVSSSQFDQLIAAYKDGIKNAGKAFSLGTGIVLIGLLLAPNLTFKGVPGLAGAFSLFFGGIIVLLSIILVCNSLLSLLTRTPRVSTAIGVLGYYTDGRSVAIDDKRFVLLKPIHITPKSPTSGLVYFVYHTEKVILSIEPSTFIPK